MYDTSKLVSVLSSAGVSASESEFNVLFSYNLPSDGSHTEVDGAVGATDTELYSAYGEKLAKRILLSDISEFSLVHGVGCVRIECSLVSGEDEIICRGDGKYTRMFIEAISDLNRLTQGVKVSPRAYSTGRACARCGRPLSPGSDLCQECRGKSSEMRRLFTLAAPWKHLIALSVLLYFVSAAVNLLPPYLNRILVDNYINVENPILTGFLLVLISIFAVTILTQGISVLRSVLMLNASTGLIKRLRQTVFDRAQALSISKISERTSGELLNRISRDTDRVNNFFVQDLGEMIQQVVVLLAISVILFVYDYRIALLVISPVPVILFLNRYVRRVMHRFFRLEWTSQSRVSSILHDTFSGIRVVKSFGMEKREIERNRAAAEKRKNVSIQTEQYSGTVMPLLSFLMGIGEFFIMYYAGNRILNGTMTLGQMLQFSSYAGLIYGPLRWMSMIPRMISHMTISVAKIFEIIDDSSEIADREDAVSFDIHGDVEIKNLCFSYDGAHKVLTGVNATVKAGEMIGIVGRSGVGKSTLINLIMRMYDPTDGAILIDGHDLRDISQSSLRSQIGVVLQETFLFSGSIYDNIAYARPDAGTEEIIAASKLSGAHKFISRLPDGYNTQVGEHGYSLSGGERQRVSIARALLRNPRILILDEATSALDTETEKDVQNSLYKLTRGRTTFAIAHRLSTLRNADRIMVLDRGKVAEFGSHDELMRLGGIYFELVMAQRQMSQMSKAKR